MTSSKPKLHEKLREVNPLSAAAAATDDKVMRIRFWVKSHIRARRRPLTMLLVLSCVWLLVGSIGAQVKPIRRVLVIYELGPNYPAIALIDQGISETLKNSPYQIEVYREYLDTALFPDPVTQQEFRIWYTRKYRDRTPDVIIAVGPSALGFMIAAHEAFFHDVPVVFCLTSEKAAGRVNLESHFTGVWEEPEPAKTLEAALRLRPGTKHVFLVGGTSPYDRSIEALYRERLHSYESKLDFQYLTDLAMPQLLERLRRLPDHSVVLHLGILRDMAGTQFIDATEAGPMVVQAANAPVFTFSDLNLGHGEAGGDVLNLAAEGKVSGATALRILSGEKPQEIPIVRNVNVYMFDWRALKHWGMKESNLPPGSIVLNRQPGFWELYKRYVLAGILLLLVQSAAIVELLWQRAQRRKTEEKFSKGFRQSPLAFTITTTKDHRYVEVNDTFERHTGWMRDEVIGRTTTDIDFWVDPNQRFAFTEKLIAKGRVQDIEVKFRRKDGQIRAGLGSAELIEINGEPCALSVIADITERKQVEEALASMSRKLIGAQEQERTRIARELHDDINQRIAMLSIDLERLEQTGSPSGPEHQSCVRGLQKRLLDLGSEVQAISHRLHSSKLEYLGLVVVCRSFCKEVAERQKVAVEFTATDVPREIPQEVSLCVFRVLQESLNNAIKYSNVQRFEVQLHGQSGEIELKVHDGGVGFDAESAMSGEGLGLISMRERAGLVNGTISIRSKRMGGTEVSLRVPLVSGMSAVEMASGAA